MDMKKPKELQQYNIYIYNIKFMYPEFNSQFCGESTGVPILSMEHAIRVPWL